MPPRDPILDKVADQLRQRAGVTTVAAPRNIYEWAARYRRIDRREFTLDRFRPLRALYEDNHPRIVVMKPAQRGVSEWAISLACFALENGAAAWVPDGSKSGLNVAIIFPARGDLIDFSKERLSSLKEESPHLAMMFGGDEEFDALGFKQVGDSFLYLRGGYSTTGLRSFPADLVILDEFDALDPGAVSLARRRLNASVVKREVMISTPSIPGKGISRAYESTDQRVYQTPCAACGEWNTYDFFRDVYCDGEPWDEWQKWAQDHVERSITELRCPRCGAVQSEADRCANGRWVALQPEITRTHGYHIPWWPFTFISLDALAFSATSPDPTEIEEFHRSDLGLPHGVGGGVIDEEMLARLSAALPDGLPAGPWRNTTMGVDIGARMHYRVSSEDAEGHVVVRDMGVVEEWPQLDHLMSRYQVRMAVLDAEPELHLTIQFCMRWRGRAMRAFYPTTAGSLKGVMYSTKKGSYDVQVNRVMAMDYVYGIIAGDRERWPREITNDPEVIGHMKAPTRIKVTDEKTGQQSYAWVHTTPDHGFHACVYDRIAREVLPKTHDTAPAVGGVRSLITDDPRASTGTFSGATAAGYQAAMENHARVARRLQGIR